MNQDNDSPVRGTRAGLPDKRYGRFQGRKTKRPARHMNEDDKVLYGGLARNLCIAFEAARRRVSLRTAESYAPENNSELGEHWYFWAEKIMNSTYKALDEAIGHKGSGGLPTNGRNDSGGMEGA